MPQDEPVGLMRLSFGAAGGAAPSHRDLSCVAIDGDTMFVAGDEQAAVDRLLWDGDGFGQHERIALGDLVDLPGGPEGEMDIEGLAIDRDEGGDGGGPWLWVLGSQALRRRKPDPEAQGPDALARMEEVRWDANRQFLGRFPLAEEGGALRPVARDGERRAAHLRFTRTGKLRRWLRRDPHLRAFLDIPSKENGLDVEGIVVRGTRVWLGLRGPVLRRRAVVLEMDLRPTRGGHLKARRIEGRARVRKHLLDARGLGIRDLKWDGPDLLAVVGTVMSGDGPAAVLRAPRFAERTAGGIVGDDTLDGAARLPYRGAVDHPEGLAHLGGGEWLVIYDSPAEGRVGDDPPHVMADIVRLR